ncbi:MAG: efflux RND transporter periplasmic adaptor subunit [Phycisphaerae bacterium]
MAEASKQKETGTPSLAARLGQVRAGIRQDLEVTRHLFRGQPAYVVRDPMTFQSHRLSPSDYEIFVSLVEDKELGEIFAEMVDAGRLAADDEESFYQFIFNLHQLNFLNLPFSNEKLLYRRHVRQKQSRRRQKILGFLFLRIPLVNPDAFLERTLDIGRQLFSRWFFACWVCLMMAAGYVGWVNFPDLTQPIQGVLMAGNLPLMWLTLVGLKVIHELGHAYACKHYGGYVPEMGAFLIVFTPCAYVDATACWGFTRRRDRLVVCLAGMYVESVAAALALFAWALSAPGLVRDLAYNVIVLAGIVTVLFNINPLMRFDGYYVLTDLVEVPNLRAKASRFLAGLAKRALLSIQVPPTPGGFRLRALLFGFGTCAFCYRLLIMVSISALLALKIPIIGLGVAGLVLGMTVYGMVVRLVKYLWHSEETAPVRVRAVALSLVVLTLVPAGLLFAPMPIAVRADGVLGQAQERVVRTGADGFVARIDCQPGDRVSAGQVLAQLEHDAYAERVARAQALVDAADIRSVAFAPTDPARAQQEKIQGDIGRRLLAMQRRKVAELTVRTDVQGMIIDALGPTETGLFLRKGQPVATVASGDWQLRVLLSEQEMADAQPTEGDEVEVRSRSVPGRTWRGVVERVAPAGFNSVDLLPLTHVGGGQIAVDPQTQRTQQPYFEVEIKVEADEPASFLHGATCRVRFPAGYDTIGRRAVRKVIRFVNRVSQG